MKDNTGTVMTWIENTSLAQFPKIDEEETPIEWGKSGSKGKHQGKSRLKSGKKSVKK
jgi:hypothetical protein